MLAVGGLLATLLVRGDVSEARGVEEDDLLVVRRAVAQNRPETATPIPPTIDEERPPARKAATPKWLRVRITERGRKKVSINVPLSLARAVGEDLPIHWGCRRRCDDDERRTVRLGDVLRALDSGQDIVQVDSDEGTVRVWVE
jgi:hypothetical protein